MTTLVSKEREDRRWRVRSLRRSDWPRLERLFGEKGACGGCWCMLWRLPRGGKLWDTCKGEKNRNAFRQLVISGEATGVLAFEGRTPVGWCSTGPREHFPKLDNSPSLRIPMPPAAWVVTCFYIPARWRGQGIGTQLLQEAVRHAQRNGASALYGFPVKPAGSASVPPAFAWTGLPKMFSRAGFRKLSTLNRPVYRIVFS